MEKLSKTLSESQTEILSELIGQEFRFVGGPDVPEYLITDSFIVGASKTCVSVHGDVFTADSQNAPEDFAHLVVKESSVEEIEETSVSGNMFLINRKSLITGVSLVRETLIHKNLEMAYWSFETDIAIVIHLESGFIFLRLISHSNEALAASFVSELDVKKFEETSSSYTDSLMSKYESSLKIIYLSPHRN